MSGFGQGQGQGQDCVLKGKKKTWTLALRVLKNDLWKVDIGSNIKAVQKGNFHLIAPDVVWGHRTFSLLFCFPNLSLQVYSAIFRPSLYGFLPLFACARLLFVGEVLVVQNPDQGISPRPSETFEAHLRGQVRDDQAPSADYGFVTGMNYSQMPAVY